MEELKVKMDTSPKTMYKWQVSTLKDTQHQMGVVVHARNPSSWEAEARGS
jgi:hypothetical protein